jgi:hypothetical protein
MSTTPATDDVDHQDQADPPPLPRRFHLDQDARWRLGGALASVVVAFVLFTRYSIYDWLTRDEAIYVYGGQQMSHGVAPYASILDPKGPVTTMLCGLGTGLAKLFGTGDIVTIRVVFLFVSVLCVLAAYFVVVQLWKSVIAGLVTAVVFSSFETFAHDAIAGPDAKTPGILFGLVAIWLAARRQWFWAGFAASLAALTWQPFFPYPLVALLAPLVWTAGRSRLKTVGLALAGLVAPFLAFVVYFAAAGALGDFFGSAFVFPLRGVKRTPETVGHRIHRIIQVANDANHFSAGLLWIGLILLLLAAVATVVRDGAGWRQALASPFVLLVVVTGVLEVGYACYDFQGYPDVFPLMPYAALGFGGAVALVLQFRPSPMLNQVLTATAVVAATLLTVGSAVLFTRSDRNKNGLHNERAAACAVRVSLVPGTAMYAMGDPIPLALMHRRNPDRYVYLGSGLDTWKVKHTKGGFAGWTQQVLDSRASVIVLDVWRGPYRLPMQQFLVQHGYLHGYIGNWQVFVTPEAHARMVARHIKLQNASRGWPTTETSRKFNPDFCNT